MTLLCMAWGFQQVAIKATAVDMPPILQICVRSGIAAALVWSLMRFRGERIAIRDGLWRPGLIVGLLFSLEFLFAGESLRHTTASHVVVFLYTAPIFAALGLHWKLPSERLRSIQWIGVALAFAGIITAFSGRSAHSSVAPDELLLGDLLALLAGLFWGATTVVIRTSRLSNAPASETLFYQLVAAFLILLLAATASGQAHAHLTPLVLCCLAFQSFAVSFASFLAWYWLLRVYLASRLGVLSFMTPLFGVAFGVWLLKEPVEASFLAGAGLVVFGLVLVSGREWLERKQAAVVAVD